MLAQVYIEFVMEDRRTASKNVFDWLSKQIELLRGKVETSERSLLEYEGQENVVSLERRKALRMLGALKRLSKEGREEAEEGES